MLGLLFWGRRIVGVVSDHSHRDEGEHHERDVAMPPVPGPGLVVVKAEFVLRGLQALFDRPTMAFDRWSSPSGRILNNIAMKTSVALPPNSEATSGVRAIA